MATFAYTGATASKKVVKGTITADSLDAAKKALLTKKIKVTEIKEAVKEKAKVEKKEPVFRNLEKRKVNPNALVIFTRQLATLVGAGVPFSQSLNTLQEASTDPVLAQIIGKVYLDVAGGMPLYQAMEKYPKTFDKVFVSLVMAGEEGGILETVLLRLASYYEKQKKVRAAIKKAMTMPIVTLVGTGVAVSFMMIYVVPMFQNLYAQVTLPLPTRIVVFVSDSIRTKWFILFPGIIGTVVFTKRFLATAAGKDLTDRLKLKIPVFSELFEKSYMASFSMTLASLLSSGLPIVRSLEICIGVLDNNLLTKAINNSIASIQGGDTLSGPLEDSGYFPKVLTRMIAVGEETGNVDGMLEKAAELYEQEVETAVGTLTAVLEPMMTVGVGGIIGVIMMAMYLPMFGMMDAMKGK